jgi:hypothetical protein
MGPIVSTQSSNGGYVPTNALVLALKNFQLELKNLLAAIRPSDDSLRSQPDPVREKLRRLTLSNDAIWARERQRPEVRAPLIIKAPYLILCLLLDVLFDGNPIERFYFLETVARMPYFSYITMLHAYETLGWWRRSSDAKRVHFAEVPYCSIFF